MQYGSLTETADSVMSITLLNWTKQLCHRQFFKRTIKIKSNHDTGSQWRG